jgi:hypothetical protein
MPNGKGQLDCCYCIHFESEYEGSDAMYDEGFCKFHKAEIPSTLGTGKHRICIDIELNKYFDFYLQFSSLEERLNWFEISLKGKILYGFPYNFPPAIEIIKDL